ncbi:MAG: hypothetical protein DRP63_00235 [Planctomycetota bacterium]|nr:MAG: hypothetical protein DRP63_00235 [Planctomycetota bacterium]
MKKSLIEVLNTQANVMALQELLLMMLLEKFGKLPNRLLVYRVECPCGRNHYVALTTERPDVVGVARSAEEARRRLLQNLNGEDGSDSVPDFLPEDI